MNFQQQQALANAQAMQRNAGGAGGITPQQQQQIAMAQQMANQYGGGMTPQQQQQIAMAQQMAAQYGGGMTPEQQQQVAMAQKMAAQYGGGMTPEQQQQVAMAQKMASQYGGGAAGVGAAPGYAPPAAPMVSAPSGGGGGDSTVITANFPDGCIIGYDRLRNELIINGKSANTRMRMMPARPISAAGSVASGMGDSNASAAPATPVEKQGTLTKLGWKKTMLGADSWQPRHFVLSPTTLSYAKSAGGAPIDTIQLNSGVTVNVVNASTPARKNRYEDNDAPGVGALMSMNIGAMKSETSGPIGKDNCVELIVPGQIGTMLDGLMAQNVVGLAFGGGAKDMSKTAQGRTYYLHCSSRKEADEWCNALRNNVEALPKEAAPAPGQIGGANGYAGLNNLVNNAMSMKNTMADAQDPHKSLDWYKRSLGTELPNKVVFDVLTKFYNDLDRAGVRHA